MRHPISCFVNVVLVGLGASDLAISTLRHEGGWAIFGALAILWGAFNITREIYL